MANSRLSRSLSRSVLRPIQNYIEDPLLWENQEYDTRANRYNKIKELTQAMRLGFWQGEVLDKDLTAPPSIKSKGRRYIPKATATGDWAGHEDEIAHWDGSAWQFIFPYKGMILFVNDDNTYYYYSGSAWIDLKVLFATVDELPALTTPYKGLRIDSAGTGLEWRRPPQNTSKNHILYYEDFESYSVNDQVHSASQDGVNGAGTPVFEIQTDQAQEGSNSFKYIYTGSTSGLTFNNWNMSIGTPISGAVKISYYYRYNDTDGNDHQVNFYCTYWDNTAGTNKTTLLFGFKRTGNTMQVFGTTAFTTVRSGSTGTWYLLEFWFRTNTNEALPEYFVKYGGTRYPTTDGVWENFSTSNWGDGDRLVSIDRLYIIAYWVREIWIDKIQIETFDGDDDTPDA